MKPLPKKATRNVTMAALLIEEVTRQLAKDFSMGRTEVTARLETVPIEDTMLSEMCPDAEAAFCFPQKYRHDFLRNRQKLEEYLKLSFRSKNQQKNLKDFSPTK